MGGEVTLQGPVDPHDESSDEEISLDDVSPPREQLAANQHSHIQWPDTDDINYIRKMKRAFLLDTRVAVYNESNCARRPKSRKNPKTKNVNNSISALQRWKHSLSTRQCKPDPASATDDVCNATTASKGTCHTTSRPRYIAGYLQGSLQQWSYWWTCLAESSQ